MNRKSQPINYIYIVLISAICMISFQLPLDKNEQENSFHSIEIINNSTPKFIPINDIHAKANSTQLVDIQAIDALIISASEVPEFVVFQSINDENATLAISPNNTHIGDHSVKLTAANSTDTTSIYVKIKVYPDNGTPIDLPLFNSINPLILNSDTTATIGIFGSYTNQIVPVELPSFMALTDHQDGSSELFIQPNGSNEGNYQLQFFAFGRDGKDTLDLDISILPGTPITMDSLCPSGFVNNYSITSNFENLFDEQYLMNNAASPTGYPITTWHPGWDPNSYPAIGYIDFGAPQKLSRIFLRDMNGDGSFKVFTGSSPSEKAPHPVVIDSLKNYAVWNEHPINVTTQYLFFEMENPYSTVAEVLVYGGCNIEIDSIPPTEISDLEIKSITSKTVGLTWSPTGDDMLIGNATTYDVRYSSTPITESSFDSLPSFLVNNIAPTDTIVSRLIRGLACDSTYYFAVKAIDDSGNISLLSNQAIGTTIDCNSNITITINFDSTLLSVPDVEIAELRFNKDVSYSITFDDGSLWEYNVSYPILNGGITPDGEIHEGFFYTDGCGNDQVFRGAISINGQDILDQAYGTSFMTWNQVETLFNNDWDVINHSYSHCAASCPNYNAEVEGNTSIIAEKIGFTPTHFAVPSGDNDGYRQAVFDNGMVAMHGQYLAVETAGGIRVDTLVNLDSFELHRNTLEFEDTPYGNDLDSIFDLSQNGIKYWLSEYAHRVGYPGEPYIFILAEDFKNYMTHIENNFGRYGADNIWFAPIQETYEYLAVRNNIIISSSEISGNQMTIQLDLSNVPTNLRRNALTLVVDTESSSPISNIELTNANFTFNTSGLINLDW